MTEESEWGGAREGAGRKPIYDKKLRNVVIQITEEHKAQLRAIGNGNQSLGARLAVDGIIQFVDAVDRGDMQALKDLAERYRVP